MFLLGISCGFPLALTASTLKTWLAEFNIKMNEIAMFSFIALPYSIKFLWAPLLDGLRLPYLGKFLGQRRSWLLITQICLIIAIFLLSRSQPDVNLTYCAAVAVAVAFFSATQDIIVDAYRIEKFDADSQAMAVTVYIYGYRLGLYICGAVLLIIADLINWNYAYSIGAIIITLGILVTIFSSEPKHIETPQLDTYHAHFKRIVIEPFKDFITTKGWPYLLLFIILFKLGDAILGSMTNPFLVNLGFSKTEIAVIVKTFGLPGTLLGTFIGGLITKKYGLIRCLMIAAILQTLSNAMFILQNYVGHDQAMLTTTIIIENMTGGIGDVIFIGFISSLCNVNFAATQYALLSSLTSVGRALIPGTLGFVIDDYGWVVYFILSMIAALPGILLIFKIRNLKRRVK